MPRAPPVPTIWKLQTWYARLSSFPLYPPTLSESILAITSICHQGTPDAFQLASLLAAAPLRKVKLRLTAHYQGSYLESHHLVLGIEISSNWHASMTISRPIKGKLSSEFCCEMETCPDQIVSEVPHKSSLSEGHETCRVHFWTFPTSSRQGRMGIHIRWRCCELFISGFRGGLCCLLVCHEQHLSGHIMRTACSFTTQ